MKVAWKECSFENQQIQKDKVFIAYPQGGSDVLS